MQNKASPEFFETRIPETRSQCKDLLLESTFAQKKKRKKKSLAKTNVTQSMTKFSLIVHLLPLLQFLISVL